MPVHEFAPPDNPVQESDSMPQTAPIEAPSTPQRSISILGWGIAFAGGAAIWAAIFAAFR